MILAAGAVVSPTRASANTDPKYTISRYMQTVTGNYLRKLGENLGRATVNHIRPLDAKLILDFGAMVKFGTADYGATLFSGTNAHTLAIRKAVEQFALGYYYASGLDSTLEIVVGTNTSSGPVDFDAGTAWARMINNLNDDLSQDRISWQVWADAGNDIESGWADYSSVIDWINGYQSVANFRYYNYGGAAGCPSDVVHEAEPKSDFVNHTCNAGKDWTQSQIYTISYGKLLAWPFPEIYNTSEASAWQWERIGMWGYYHATYGFLDLSTVLTQYASCHASGASLDDDATMADIGTNTDVLSLGSVALETAVSPSRCGNADNTPAQAYTQMNHALNSRDESATQMVSWLSDIRWDTHID